MDLRLTRARRAGAGRRARRRGGGARVYVRVQGVQARIDAGRGAAARGGARRRPPVRLGAASARSSPESRLAAAGVSPRAPGGGGEPRAARLDAARRRSAPCPRDPRSRSHRRARSQAPRLVNAQATPRLRPIFLLATQTEGTVEHVFCEDYDSHNRIRIIRTAGGWQVLPCTAFYDGVRFEPPDVEPRRHRHRRRRRRRGRPRRLSPKSEADEAWLPPDLESHIPSHTIPVPRAPPEPTPLDNLLAVAELEFNQQRGERLLELEDSSSYPFLPAEEVARDVMSFELGESKPQDEMFFDNKTEERVEDYPNDMVAHKDLFETISEAHYLPELGGPHDEALLESLVEKGCEDNQILGQTLDKLANLVHGSGEYVEEEEDILLGGAPVADIIDRLGSLESPGRSSITAAQGLLHLHHIGDHLPPAEHRQVDESYMSGDVYDPAQHGECAMETLAAASELQEANQVNHLDYDRSADKRLENNVESTDVMYTESVPESRETYNSKTFEEPQPQSLPDQSEPTITSDASNSNICEDMSSKQQQETSNEEIHSVISDHTVQESNAGIDESNEFTEEELHDTSRIEEAAPTDLSVKHIDHTIMPLRVSSDIETSNTTIEDNLSEKSDELPRDLSVHRRLPTPHASPRRIDIPRAPSRESDAMQSPQPSGIPAVPSSPEIFTMPSAKSKQTLFLETLLSSPSPKMYTSEVTITKQQCEPLNLGKHRKSASPTITSCSDEMRKLNKEFGEPQEKRQKRHSTEDLAKISKVFNMRCDEQISEKNRKSNTPTSNHKSSDETSPLKQLQVLKTSPDFNIPDPLLVPKDKLNPILAAPGREIPALLIQRPELRLPEAFAFPAILQDPDILVVSLTQLENILENDELMKKIPKKDQIKECKGESKEKQDRKEATSTTPKSPKPTSGTDKAPTPQPQPDQTNHPRSTPNTENLAGDIDAATSAALNHMMWLPYLSQLEALNACSQNMDFMKALNSSGYNGPNYSDISQAFNPSARFMGPGGFPMMPPMDYDSRLQFAMWQETMARNAASSQRPKSMDTPMKEMPKSSQSDVQNPYVHSTKNHQSKTQSARTSPIAHNYNNQRAMGHNPFLQGMYPGMNPNLRPNMPLPGLQIPYFNPQMMMGSQRSPRTAQQKSPTSPYYPNNNYLQAFKQADQGHQRSGSTSSQDSPRPRISVKSLQNLMDPAAAGAGGSGVASSRRGSTASTSSMGRRREETEVGSTTPLGEPPPHMPPHPHDPASYHLWHPLFGNQKGYNSPWSWTTVTATGD